MSYRRWGGWSELCVLRILSSLCSATSLHRVSSFLRNSNYYFLLLSDLFLSAGARRAAENQITFESKETCLINLSV